MLGDGRSGLGHVQEVTAPGTGHTHSRSSATPIATAGSWAATSNDNFGASSSVAVRGFGKYRTIYSISFNAVAGDIIRVWMYSPASPGYVVIDDVSLIFDGLAP